MHDRVKNLLQEIKVLEAEILKVLQEKKARAQFTVSGKKVEFEHAVHLAHKRVKLGLFRWFITSHPLNMLSVPFIYSMIVPLVFFDLSLTLYQAVCFRLYRIPRVRRADYLIFDRHNLGYLNLMERFHCEYCAYANGLVAYGREIIGRTEQYWCPIKHALKVLHPHEQYGQFLEYGDAVDYQSRLEALRRTLLESKKVDAEAALIEPGGNRTGR
ncbi:MAG: hypothetical protein HY291_16005 [Planctomycetes bacterium]|nr:hypothetical protein [Planctomycetota bacterium]